ncbi:MAG TPA: SET domain-containing protein [Nevskiaceae bacterium]|nr:SET domain-containing protein [Nevskiaceae bacterium]
MIIPKYSIRSSTIAGAGKGLFLDEPVSRGAVVVAPDRIDRMMHLRELEKFPKDSIENISSARWFEDWFSISPEWPDECYVNHSDAPNGLWHLGFIFAARDLAAGEELTADYRYILGSHEPAGFADSATGRVVVGLEWKENVRRSAEALLRLL